MSAIEREYDEGARCEIAHVIPSNQANSAQGRVYPLLMIGGVYRMSFAMGLAVYALTMLPTSISRHRARVNVRRACHALRHNVNPSNVDVSPRDPEPSAKNNTQRTIGACTRQARQDRGRPR